METKNALYAAVGAPVAVAKTLNARLETLRSELESRTDGLSEAAQKRFEEWTEEGRQVVTRVSDGKMVDELASKVDFDQAREQVTKLRDQLEDMLATWRTSFRPDDDLATRKAGEESTGSAAKGASRPAAGSKPATKPSAGKTAAKKPAANKPAAQKSSSAKASPKKSTAQASAKKGTTKSSSTGASKATTKS